MTEKTVRLVPKDQAFIEEVNANIIERLEWAKSFVSTGELFAGVGIVITHRDGSTTTTFSKTENQAVMIGGLERLKHRLLTSDD
jgi:hypothetical protein